MESLQKSELVIAKILNMAIEKGIQEWDLSFGDLDLDEEYAPFFYQCLYWLENEGIIRVTDYHQTIGGIASGSVRNPVLTSFGMIALGHKIKFDDEITQMSEAVKQVSSGEKSYSQIGDFFGGLLGGFTKSIGS